tara:strand:- start:33304 stop:34377 length:1074 start_codon:yes stop_codon:yes gene_type:complete
MTIKSISLSLAIACIILIAYLLLWPVGFEPPKVITEPAPQLQGVLEPKSKLRNLTTIPTGLGPEDIAFDENGMIYTGLDNGQIVRWQKGTQKIENWVNTQGRPLGMEFNSKGDLIVADAIKGLLSVDKVGNIKVLATSIDNKPFNFVDDLVVGADDIVYFLDSSDQYRIVNDYVFNSFIDGRPHGRLLSYNPSTKQTELIRGKLFFPNGISLSHDSKAVLVSEMMTYRVLRIETTQTKKGELSIFSDNLPGFPNNISGTQRGTYQLALSAPRNLEVEALQANSFLRKILMRLPEDIIPKSEPVKYGLVIELNQNGQIIKSLHDPSGDNAFMLTSAIEYQGSLYLGSIGDSSVKVFGL